MRATVILVGRSKDRCKAALQEIVKRGAPNINENNIAYIVADLSSQASILELADEFLAAHRRLDVLINNAGVFLAKRITTVDGIEYTFAVNHLAPFLLTNLLIGKSETSGVQSRVITTSSVAHRGAHIDFGDIQFEKRHYNGLKAYGQSKLANILFTKELARRLKSANVTANCFHPGGVRTNLAKGNPWYYRLIWILTSPFLTSAERGADTGIYLASSSDLKETTGKYFVKRKEVNPSKEANDQETAQKLWKVSEEMTNMVR
jgi:NAD(P)-dependent dehydrogenase (short-subunit alcohol dehydrogenase family)